MNPWFSFWFKEVYLPLSGAVEQDISAWANFLSPQIEFNFAGDKVIERDVVSNIASYGTQIGLLSKVVLELSKHSKSKEVAELSALVQHIEAVKKARKDNIRKTTKEAMDNFQRQDPEAFKRLLAHYNN
ncbi:TPA: hypothetical protein ACGUZ2_004286 [Vibrio vulnificus]